MFSSSIKPRKSNRKSHSVPSSVPSFKTIPLTSPKHNQALIQVLDLNQAEVFSYLTLLDNFISNLTQLFLPQVLFKIPDSKYYRNREGGFQLTFLIPSITFTITFLHVKINTKSCSKFHTKPCPNIRPKFFSNFPTNLLPEIKTILIHF